MLNRRDFFTTMGMVGTSSLLTLSGKAITQSEGRDSYTDKEQTWLFWDLWRIDRRQNLELSLGQPELKQDAIYIDNIDGLAAWPGVFRDENAGRWRMIYTALWRPYTMMLAESEDGIHFTPVRESGLHLNGKQRAPHHIYTLSDGSCGSLYLDPIASDGYPYKIFGHQGGNPVYQRALANPSHRWNEVAQRSGIKPYMHDEITLVSRDGLHWELRPDLSWGQLGWHPEPPLFGFYNHHKNQHMMTVRPGWGDRRVCIQSTTDFKEWSGPELLLQPGPEDSDLCEFYGMPVFPYENVYVGLLWVFHCEQSEPTTGFNRFVGKIDVQLTYSYDGVRFNRGPGKPFIPLNPPGEHGAGGIEPTCLVEDGDEIRIYASSSKVHHGKNYQARQSGLKDFESILVYTLRKDGFMYLQSKGNWASFISKPLVLFGGDITINTQASTGEVLYQLTDMASKPIPNFTYEDCQVIKNKDAVKIPLKWKDGTLGKLAGKIVRLEIKFRDARIYAVRGRFHFIDAQDWQMIIDDQNIDPSLCDI